MGIVALYVSPDTSWKKPDVCWFPEGENTSALELTVEIPERSSVMTAVTLTV
jgi:hypothetical protein